MIVVLVLSLIGCGLLPCARWKTTECFVCHEEEVTQSGIQCLNGGYAECEVCEERTFWK